MQLNDFTLSVADICTLLNSSRPLQVRRWEMKNGGALYAHGAREKFSS